MRFCPDSNLLNNLKKLRDHYGYDGNLKFVILDVVKSKINDLDYLKYLLHRGEFATLSIRVVIDKEIFKRHLCYKFFFCCWK